MRRAGQEGKRFASQTCFNGEEIGVARRILGSVLFEIYLMVGGSLVEKT